jgi:hypothetical protein
MRGPPLTFLLMAVCAVGAIGYVVWDSGRVRHRTEATGDAALARPDPAECAAAQAAIGALQASGEARRRLASVGAKQLRLRGFANSVSGYLDLASEEAADSKAKGDGDWRACPGLGAYERSLGWGLMGGDDPLAEIGLSRVSIDKAGDEAQLFEVFTPQPDYGAGRHDKGRAAQAKTVNWLVTLRRAAPDAPWKVTGSRVLTIANP